ncbi:MAG: nucleotidyltransferase family protein [Ignavibacteriales bacterium]|nr:nucleotidyltransferase family protein [Ignavibacteriales bacterium]
MTRKNGSSNSRALLQYNKAIQSRRGILTDRYKVSEIGIFGSALRGRLNQRSDIDVLVDFSEVPDLLRFIELELFLEKLLKRKVDLVDKQALRAELREDILRQVVYV